ncbi:hypothetical protein [Phytomonospora endophytica]|uniref:Secreted protein n=1 Tax=Phytomonospora endophytica TaxID=714109 RepID=A0A841FQT7_9ACTN|nr:hypothetical protein [Phytomonospora endophytica]MBB6038525.1 hypothetical protein [Phytomonospora endophytica]GIG69336.1 hypothetical protein Pen01_56310 [Phytomonospora endophytica]
MLRRRLLQAVIGFGLAAVALVGAGGAANASPGGFTATYTHAGGSGALADKATGGISWYNRSVTFTSVKFWVHAGECGTLQLQGNNTAGELVDEAEFTGLCGNAATGKWYTIGDVPLDGSADYGGITRVYIFVWDDTHQGYGYTYCDRSASSCRVGAR